MKNQPIDKLLEEKIKAARRGRIVRSILLIVAALIVIGCAYSAIAYNSKRDPVKKTDLVSSQTEESTVSSPAKSSTQSQEESTETGDTEQLSVTHEMQVVWFGDSDVPDSLKINVMHDSVELFTVTLTKNDNWYFTWADGYHAQDLQFEGDYPDNISVEYTVSGDNFTLTATCITGDLPQTGLNIFSGLLMVLAGAAITTISFVSRAKESK